MIIKVTEIEASAEALIRRSDAIKALYKYNFVTKEVIEREIMDIPSVDRPRGELKYMGTYYKCSVCGSEFNDEITFMGELNYCPSCGARMKGAEDGNK